jgi:hypothetical protein
MAKCAKKNIILIPNWVKDHSDNQLNNKADNEAKSGRLSADVYQKVTNNTERYHWSNGISNDINIVQALQLTESQNYSTLRDGYDTVPDHLVHDL